MNADEPGTDGRSGRSRAGSAPRNPDAPIAPADRTLGRRGWLLVGLVVLSLAVVPWVIVFHPPDLVPFRVAYLALPLAPAVLLGLGAVWVALSKEKSGS